MLHREGAGPGALAGFGDGFEAGLFVLGFGYGFGVLVAQVFHAQAEQGEFAEVEAFKGEGQDRQVRGERVGNRAVGGGVVVDVLPGGLRPAGWGADSFLGKPFFKRMKESRKSL